MGGILKEIAKAAGNAIKTRRVAKQAEKLHQSSANVAERTRKAGDLTKASAEVKGAKKFAGKKGFKRGVAVGAGGVLAGQFLAKNKVDISVTPRDEKKKTAKKPKKKTVQLSKIKFKG